MGIYSLGTISSDNSGLWFMEREGLAVVHFNIIYKEVDEYISLKKYRSDSIAYYNILKIEDNIFVLPAHSNYILRIDIKNDYKIYEKEIRSTPYNWEKFDTAQFYDGKLFLYPCGYPWIVMWDIYHDNVQYIDMQLADANLRNDQYFTCFSLKYNEYAIMSISNTNIFYMYDMKEYKSSIIRARNIEDDYYDLVSFKDNEIVFFDSAGCLYKMDLEGNIFEKNQLSVFPKGSCWKAFSNDTDMVIVPRKSADKFIFYDDKRNRREISFFEDTLYEDAEYQHFSQGIIANGFFWAFNFKEKELFSIDLEKYLISIYVINLQKVKSNMQERIIKSIFDSNMPVYEDDEKYELPLYLKYIIMQA